MSHQQQLRRGTAAQCGAMIPAEGEVIVDTTNDRIRVGDGSRAGGWPVPTFQDCQRQSFNYCTTTGTANAITLTSSVALLSHATPVKICFVAGSNNTGATTLTIDGLSAKSLQKLSGSTLVALDADDLVSGGYYEAIYTGTVYQLLNPPITAPTPSGLVLLDEQIASGSSALNFTAFSSLYDVYEFQLSGLESATAGSSLQMRVSTDGGSSYVSTSSYSYVHNISPSSGTATTARAESQAALLLSTSRANWFNSSGVVNVRSSQSGTQKTLIDSTIVENQSSAVFRTVVGGGAYNATTVVNAVRFMFASGNITSGTIQMYGRST